MARRRRSNNADKSRVGWCQGSLVRLLLVKPIGIVEADTAVVGFHKANEVELGNILGVGLFLMVLLVEILLIFHSLVYRF